MRTSELERRRLPLLGLTPFLLAGCAAFGPSEAERHLSAERAQRERLQSETQQLRRDAERLTRENHRLEEALRKQHAQDQDLEDQLARLHLAILDRDAQIRILNEKLDAAIQEVVRAMAKLRSLEGRAEAASNLAEAEVALKTLERGPGPKPPELAQADQLLKRASDEFRKENYGGALYLTNQLKSVIKSGQSRVGGSETLPRVEGEASFTAPLPLRSLGKSSVREGPGVNFRVAFVTEEGAPLVGQSYKGTWVRVTAQDGRSGWIAYNQVAAR